MMKRICLLLLVFAAGLNFALAGPKSGKDRDEMRREIREFKMKFVAQEIELRDDQREKFTEVYGRMMTEEEAIWKEIWKAQRKLKEDKNLTDAEYEQLNAVLIEGKAKGASLEKKYDTLFAQFLTPKQRYKMKDAEMQFRRKMEQMCSEKKGKRHK
ncbi:MAG: hypothetical protein K2O24_03255 [Muribaculaceae bacterium]|nr:hypothetical protein [Muribaculaceae bacterium]